MRAEVYSKLGISYVIEQRRPDAIKAFQSAIEIDELYVPAYSNLCLALTETSEFERAVGFGEKAIGIDPSYLPTYSALAIALKYDGRLDDAIEYIRKALLLKNDDPNLQFNLASLLYEAGDKEEAEALLNDVLHVVPHHAQAHRLLASIKKATAGDERINQIETLLEKQAYPIHLQADLYFALGKLYEDVRDFRASSEAYKQANSLKRQTFEYSIDQDKAFFKNIKSVFTSGFVQNHALKTGEKSPIFILGMPRSATSLVEQILASHSEVYGAGELNFLDQAQRKLFDVNELNYAEKMQTLRIEDFQALADFYVRKSKKLCNDGRFLTDKMPQNFRYIGLIKTLFPNAKIIHCKRNRNDVALSIFKINFAGHISFAYSEKEIVQYYELYEDLMRHWNVLFPNEIYELEYPKLIENPEETIQEMLKYCDLGWEDNCMEFHKTRRAVTTASALQVRRPLYKDALEYWKNYQSYFDVLFGSAH